MILALTAIGGLVGLAPGLYLGRNGNWPILCLMALLLVLAVVLSASGWRQAAGPQDGDGRGLAALALLLPVMTGLAVGSAIGLYRWRKAGHRAPHDDVS